MRENRKLAIKYIEDRINNKCFMSYEEIAQMTGYHPKYILKLKKQIIDGTLSEKQPKKQRIPVNKISKAEEEKIVSLYKRSNASIRRFANFYGKRSYSCIYNILKKNNLI